MLVFKEVYLNHLDPDRKNILGFELASDQIVEYVLFMGMAIYYSSSLNSNEFKQSLKETGTAQSRLFTTIKLQPASKKAQTLKQAAKDMDMISSVEANKTIMND